jgi:energy-coupling factor transporter ATP-binding protein EcfA2
MMARLVHLDIKRAKVRTAELLEQFDLTEAARKPTATYSSGMGRRLDLAMSLMLNPAIVFLDEPTTGVDPRGRAVMWTSCAGWQGRARRSSSPPSTSKKQTSSPPASPSSTAAPSSPTAPRPN